MFCRVAIAPFTCSVLCSLLLTAPAKAQADSPIETGTNSDRTAIEQPSEDSSENVPANSSDNPSGNPTVDLLQDAGHDRPWPLFTSEAGQFRIALPSDPAAYTFGDSEADEASTASLSDSRLYMQMQLVDAAHLEIYAAAFVASETFIAEDINVADALAGCVTSLGHQIIAPLRPLTLGDYPGVEAEFFTEDDSFQVSRCYLAGDRAYLLTATSEPFSAGEGLQPENTSNSLPVRSAAMETFFNSFEILQ